jgi:hypothetical protein
VAPWFSSLTLMPSTRSGTVPAAVCTRRLPPRPTPALLASARPTTATRAFALTWPSLYHWPATSFGRYIGRGPTPISMVVVPATRELLVSRGCASRTPGMALIVFCAAGPNGLLA